MIGAGVAGLRAAIELAPAGDVLVVAKDSLHESSSEYAQGGIAAAVGEDDNPELHLADTLTAGDGLSDEAAARTLVEAGPAAIRELAQWGVAFDTAGGKVALAREGAHSRSRVLHSHGDSTGREIARGLYQQAASLPGVRFLSFAAVFDLAVADGRVTGAWALDAAGNVTLIRARAVLLATGGLGCVYSESTNPDIATGDGVAMAYRAGAEIADIEFVQFHPTALRLEGAPRFLLSEALRGEGAHLVNARGERFMPRYHQMAELAPRDVVARAIVTEGQAWLDLRHRGAGFAAARFPRIHATCLRYGLDLDAAPAPVYPAAHYAMGGVRTDLDGRTSLAGLYAAGEAAATGLHGANRLASNSLLEGVVYGARAGRAMLGEAGGLSAAGAPPEACAPALETAAVRELAWRHCGIERSGAGLEEAVKALGGARQTPVTALDRSTAERRNVHAVVLLIARCALARRECRGAHYRMDYPGIKSPIAKHSVISQDLTEVRFQ